MKDKEIDKVLIGAFNEHRGEQGALIREHRTYRDINHARITETKSTFYSDGNPAFAKTLDDRLGSARNVGENAGQPEGSDNLFSREIDSTGRSRWTVSVTNEPISSRNEDEPSSSQTAEGQF